MSTPRPQSNFVHLLANPADRERFEQAKETMRPRMIRAPIQADVIAEMLDTWEALEPIRALISEHDAGRQITIPETAKYLIEHWETT